MNMNKAIVIALATLAPSVASAQGTFNFNNTYVASGVLPGVSAPIYAWDCRGSGDPVPADDNFYVTVLGGSLPGAAGVNIAGQTLGNLRPLKMAATGSTNVLKTFRTGPNAGFIAGGGAVFYQPAGAGTRIAVQVVAWSKSLGSDLTSAFAAWQLGYGGGIATSAVMQITLAAGSDPNQPRLAPSGGTGVDPTKCSDPGLTSFVIFSPCPEPSVLALAGVGMAGALVLRRRQS